VFQNTAIPLTLLALGTYHTGNENYETINTVPAFKNTFCVKGKVVPVLELNTTP
jgi:hypothetical protein